MLLARRRCPQKGHKMLPRVPSAPQRSPSFGERQLLSAACTEWLKRPAKRRAFCNPATGHHQVSWEGLVSACQAKLQREVECSNHFESNPELQTTRTFMKDAMHCPAWSWSNRFGGKATMPEDASERLPMHAFAVPESRTLQLFYG